MASHFYLRTPSSEKTSLASQSVPIDYLPQNSNPPPSSQAATQPKKRSRDRASAAMRLPSGYTTEHWAWSMSDPSFRASEFSTLPWDELDDTFLFSTLPVKEPSILMEEIEDDFDTQKSSSDDSISFTSSSPTSSRSMKGPLSRPNVSRSESHAEVKSPRRQEHAQRANSITVSIVKSARRTRRQQQDQRASDANRQRKVSEVLILRRQVADLTQRLTMMMANQCAACQLGLIECGLNTASDEDEERPEARDRSEEDWKVQADIDGKMDRLAQQAQLLSF